MVATVDNWYSYLLFQIIHREIYEYQLSMVATVDNGYSYYYFKSFIKKYMNTSCQWLQQIYILLF